MEVSSRAVCAINTTSMRANAAVFGGALLLSRAASCLVASSDCSQNTAVDCGGCLALNTTGRLEFRGDSTAAGNTAGSGGFACSVARNETSLRCLPPARPEPFFVADGARLDVSGSRAARGGGLLFYRCVAPASTAWVQAALAGSVPRVTVAGSAACYGDALGSEAQRLEAAVAQRPLQYRPGDILPPQVLPGQGKKGTFWHAPSVGRMERSHRWWKRPPLCGGRGRRCVVEEAAVVWWKRPQLWKRPEKRPDGIDSG